VSQKNSVARAAAKTGGNDTVISVQGNLRVLQFNLWQEGTSVPNGFSMIVDAIIAADVDIVTLCEVRNYGDNDLHERLKAALKMKGQHFYGVFVGEKTNDVGVLSRYPIERSDTVANHTDGIAAWHIRVSPQKLVCVIACHLDYTHYALNLPRGYGDGNHFGWKKLFQGHITDPRVLHHIDAESGRPAAAMDILRYIAQLDPGMAVILAGDFNEDSHLDWTEATKNLQGHHGVAIDWRNSQRIANAGLVDSWREVHPDPVAHPGATWPSEASGQVPPQPSWAHEADERDRIDFVYHSRHLRAVGAQVVGSTRYIVEGKLKEPDSQGPFVAAVKDLPWPSDHKAVRVELAFV
jgi:endonuclease/exonuclease/phosphatase family metal-dependent hydrolase